MNIAETMIHKIQTMNDQFLLKGYFEMPGWESGYEIPHQSLRALMRVVARQEARPFIFTAGNWLHVPRTKTCSFIWAPLTLAGNEVSYRYAATSNHQDISYRAYTKHFDFYFKSKELLYDYMRQVMSDPDDRKKLKLPW